MSVQNAREHIVVCPSARRCALNDCKIAAGGGGDHTLFPMDLTEIRYKNSKNVFSERRRRQKMNKLLYTLRALVPNISKMDKASILADAIDHVNALKKELETVESSNSSRSPDSFMEETDSPTVRLDAARTYGCGRKYLLQADVREIEAGTVELRIQSRKESGVLFQLTRALESLPFRLKSASFNTLDEHLVLHVTLQGGDSRAMTDGGVRKSIRDCFNEQGLIFHGNDN